MADTTGLFGGGGVPVDVTINLNTKTYLYLGSTIVASIIVGYMLTRLISKI